MDRISFINSAGEKWTEVAKYEALEKASNGILPAVSEKITQTVSGMGFTL